MMPRDLPDFAELWREQIDPAELAGLEALAKTIKRTAWRRKVFDFALAFASLAVILLGSLVGSEPWPMRLDYVLFSAVLIVWAVWKRHQIAVAARALVVRAPPAFFAAVIGNARAELNFSTLSVALFVPVLILALFLHYAVRGLTSLDLILRDLFETHFLKTMVFAAIILFVYVLFVRANIKLREQLRRLESMRREWEEQDARDLEEG